MQFNSLAFFLFLSFAIITSSRLKLRPQNLWLVVLSYAFYAFWDWRFCGLMLLATSIGYVSAIRIEQAFQKSNEKLARKWMIYAVCASIAILCIFKYSDFFIVSARALLIGVFPSLNVETLGIILPAGISFYLFHTISYVVDVYRKEIKATNDFVEVALFLSFFPQLIAGPIARSKSLLPQCQKERIVTPELVRSGLTLILIGLVRKVAIADTAGALADPIFSHPEKYSGLQILNAVFWYSVQIYSDFAGYSDLAIGSAMLFGFKLTKNFDHPYIAQNVSDFWRRWHISLSSWLRDYLYIPLGGNRKGKVRTYINLSLTMLLGGLWHGASWNFVLWGALHGAYLIGYQIFSAVNPIRKSNVVLQILGTGLTLVFVALAWIPFRCQDFSMTLTMLTRISETQFRLTDYVIPTLFFLFTVTLIDLPQIWKRNEIASLSFSKPLAFIYIAFLICLLVLCGDLRGAAFIYFQF